ncbi:MAG: hypothetical protein COA97_10980 [Flavobacteriales bacterium]|nr:MAG: hypothetical protein COA97_10980 [Flavobacteriales bacterium]
MEESNINGIIKSELSEAIKNNLKGNNLLGLDVGFGTGILSYQLVHLHNFSKIVGVESEKRNHLTNEKYRSHSNFRQSVEGNPVLSKYVVEEFDSYRKIIFFQFYQKYVEEELGKTPLNEGGFEEVFDSNFQFGTEVKNYSWSNNYDMIILSRVLHYMEKEEQIDVLKKAVENLNKKGVLFIVNRLNTEKSIDLTAVINMFNLKRVKEDLYKEKHVIHVLVKL